MLVVLVSTNYTQTNNNITIEEYNSFLLEAKTKYLEKAEYGFKEKKNLTKEDIKQNMFFANRIGFPTLTEMYAKEVKAIQKKCKGDRTKYNEQFNRSKKMLHSI